MFQTNKEMFFYFLARSSDIKTLKTFVNVDINLVTSFEKKIV